MAASVWWSTSCWSSPPLVLVGISSSHKLSSSHILLTQALYFHKEKIQHTGVYHVRWLSMNFPDGSVSYWNHCAPSKSLRTISQFFIGMHVCCCSEEYDINTVRKLFLNVNREICNTMLMSFFVHVMADNRWRVAMSSEVLFCRKEILKSIASSTLSALPSLLFTRTGGTSS